MSDIAIVQTLILSKKAIKYFAWDFFFSVANVYGLIKILSRTIPNIISEHFNRIHETKICFTVSCLGEMIGSKMSLKKTFLYNQYVKIKQNVSMK